MNFEELQNKIKRMNELYPRWFKIIDGCCMDSFIHGWKPNNEDSKVLVEFAKLMKEVGITNTIEGCDKS